MKVTLGDGQLKELANELAPIVMAALSPVPTPDPVVDPTELEPGVIYQGGKVIYTDPAVKIADETISKAMVDLPTGTATYIGRKGTMIVNHSKETIDAIESWKKNRNQWQTRTRV